MTTQLPHYDDFDAEQAPAYASGSDISARWHIINTPAKGLYGSRDTAQSTVGHGYDLVFVDSAQIEVQPRAPPKDSSGSSSDKQSKTAVIAKVKSATDDPRRANIIFTSEGKETIIVNARDLGRGTLTLEDPEPDRPQLITLYYADGKAELLPNYWRVDPNKEFTASLESVPEKATKDTEYNPVKTEDKKWTWKSRLKEHKEHKRAKSVADEAKFKRQKEGLSSNFSLRDMKGNIYANFTNELFKDSAAYTKVLTYAKEAKQHKSWGYLDIHDPQFKTLRSSSSTFEKWSDADLELVVLLTLVTILEINIKINGGTTPGLAFNIYGAMFGMGDPRSEGLPGVMGAALGALAGGASWIARGLDSN